MTEGARAFGVNMAKNKGHEMTAADLGDLPKKGDKASASRDAVVRSTKKELAPVQVGREKVEKAAQELAGLISEREKLQSEKRDTLAKFRDKFNSIDEQMRQLRDTVLQSTELREVDVVTRLMPTGWIERVRMDMGTLFEDARVATAEELQDNIPGTDGGAEVKGPTPFEGNEPHAEVKGPKSKAKRKGKK